MNLLKIGSKHTRKHTKTGQGRAKQASTSILISYIFQVSTIVFKYVSSSVSGSKRKKHKADTREKTKHSSYNLTLGKSLTTYLIEIRFSDVFPLSSFSQRHECVLDFLAGANVLCFTADHEGHVFSHGNDAITTDNKKILASKVIVLYFA